MSGRIVKCTIEMELIEGEHFNILNMDVTDEQVLLLAGGGFINMIEQAINGENGIDIDDWIQTKIVEEVS